SIPEKFERKHENDLSKLVLLKVPSGEAWKVALAKLNGQVFFQDGRENFSDYYFIDYGDFIVFESVGSDSAEDDDSSFHLTDEVSSDSEETQLDSWFSASQSTPSWFGRKYLTEEEGDATLTVLNEGSWPAKYHVCKTCKGSKARMKEGRGRFLAVGGIYSFHLLKDDKVVFQISISRPDLKETIRSFAS
ncbi:hypothetical protein H0E87_024150, partial [Populus deltoides]